MPELRFARPLEKDLDSLKSQEAKAHMMAKINFLNAKSEDGFMKAYLSKRDDLRGLPFLMGKDCRTDVNAARHFSEVAQNVQNLLSVVAGLGAGTRERSSFDDLMEKHFWISLDKAIDNAKKANGPLCQASPEDIERALIAATMQMLATTPEPYRVGLAKRLASMKHADATLALVKLALYAPEEKVLAAALDGLKKHNSQKTKELLLAGLRYPLPVVPMRAAKALVKLDVKTALEDLIQVLEEPDPRMPAIKKTADKDVYVVRESVRINHHHNCLLCHAPANTDDMPSGVLSAPVPLLDQSLPSPFQGYGQLQSPDIFVRTDMSYLRQDFSLMMKVEKADPWPEMQRFDFFVRTREVTTREAASIVIKLANDTGATHLAAQYALRELTGRRPAKTTPQAWRELLQLTN